MAFREIKTIWFFITAVTFVYGCTTPPKTQIEYITKVEYVDVPTTVYVVPEPPEALLSPYEGAIPEFSDDMCLDESGIAALKDVISYYSNRHAAWRLWIIEQRRFLDQTSN